MTGCTNINITNINEEDDCKGVVWFVFIQLHQPIYCEAKCYQHIYHWNDEEIQFNSFQASKRFHLK